MKIRILETETTKKDKVIKTLINTTWETDKIYKDFVIINCCDGIKIQNGEYEVISK